MFQRRHVVTAARGLAAPRLAVAQGEAWPM